jgi:hypothetical protein
MGGLSRRFGRQTDSKVHEWLGPQAAEEHGPSAVLARTHFGRRAGADPLIDGVRFTNWFGMENRAA